MIAPFDAEGSRWFSIAAHRPFVDDLARILFDHLSMEGPEALTDAIVLTPTRRGARSLAEAFVKAAGGQPVLLPQIRAVGDLDEGEPPFEPGAIALGLPPAVSPLRRRFELARLIAENAPAFERDLDTPAALEMADALAGFLDSLFIEERFHGADLGDLGGDHAAHWRQSARVLAIALERWPARLRELGLVDPTERRVMLSKRLAEQWRARPPATPLIAAGSTATAPATGELLAAVAGAPRGCVVLPGLDRNLADDAWAAIDREPQHPQFGLYRLLERNGLTREDVHPWPLAEGTAENLRGRARRRVINESLRPADATADWLSVIETMQAEAEETGVDPFGEGLEGLSVIEARTEDEAATVAALLMREALEEPDRTCALVTPDQGLARRVSAQLSRWGIEADSSAGAPLAGFPVGVLIAQAAELACDPAAPITLLGALKNPLVRLGMEEAERGQGLRAFERLGLRGPRRDGWPSLFRTLEGRRQPGRDGAAPSERTLRELDRAEAFAHAVHALIAPLHAAFGGGAIPAAEAARQLTETLQALAADAQGGFDALWSGPDGRCAAQLLAGVIAEGAALPPVTAQAFRDLIGSLLSDETVRPGRAAHPRLRILGAIEARLVRADRLILAGLEEGVWPQGAPVDPFLSRPMRRRLGLPSPERKVGLSAHDFAQAACAPEVVLLHTARRGGQPAVPSRWLLRLNTLVTGAGRQLPSRPELLEWARRLDAADAHAPSSLRPAPRPDPKPPLDARPAKLYVTQVETWVRDPYAVYARNVLGLRAMDRPDEAIDARARGTAIHAAMEGFAEAWPSLASEDRGRTFTELYLAELVKAGAPVKDLAREKPLAARAGAWIADFEMRRRRSGAHILVEREISLAIPDLNFTLAARADRIEIEDGLAHVIDFKTGGAPTSKQVRQGFAAQLPLTAAMLRRGGLADGGRPEPGELLYVRVTGRNPPGKIEERGRPGEAIRDQPASEDLAEAAWVGLLARIRDYADPERGYLSRTAPEQMKYRSDYDHLARVHEWRVVDEDDQWDDGWA
ncbi:MAG: double-strand break repair protein AddB [Caulobacteraceae bacterium]|nr:double-strand break repair protein AddB [Caulobacteraceae bacterium]